MNSDIKITIYAGTGYWEMDNFPWGGCLRRNDTDLDCTLLSVIDLYNNRALRKVILLTSDNHKIGITLD